MCVMILFQWASETGSHGMPRPEELEAQGYVVNHRHPWWGSSILMRKDPDGDIVKNGRSVSCAACGGSAYMFDGRAFGSIIFGTLRDENGSEHKCIQVTLETDPMPIPLGEETMKP